MLYRNGDKLRVTDSTKMAPTKFMCNIITV